MVRQALPMKYLDSFYQKWRFWKFPHWLSIGEVKIDLTLGHRYQNSEIYKLYLISPSLTLLLVGFLEDVNWWGGGRFGPPWYLENYWTDLNGTKTNRLVSTWTPCWTPQNPKFSNFWGLGGPKTENFRGLLEGSLCPHLWTDFHRTKNNR